MFAIPVPSNVGLAGLFVAGQLAVMDSGATAPLPFVTTNALQLTVF